LVFFHPKESFMPRVLCTLPNASTCINGVDFEPHDHGVLSVDLSDDQAQTFVAIPGYELYQVDPEEDARVKAEEAEEAQRAADEAAKKAAASKAAAAEKAAAKSAKQPAAKKAPTPASAPAPAPAPAPDTAAEPAAADAETDATEKADATAAGGVDDESVF
jgi:hypothetical protein